MTYIEDAQKQIWYCEECAASDSPGPSVHAIGDHNEGVSWPIRLAREMPPPRWCWCGRWLPPVGPVCHDPYEIYRCSCGLHLFATRETAGPGRWAWHLNHIAAFQAEMQARVDKAIADAVPVELQDVPGWATPAVDVLANAGLLR